MAGRFGEILSSLALAMFQGVRRNSADSAFEAYDTRASRPLFEFFSSRTTTAITEQTLFQYSVDRGQFDFNGDRILAEFSGTLAANVNAKYVRVKFAGTTIFDSNNIDPALGNNKSWRLRVSITRKSVSIVRCAVDLIVYGFNSLTTYTEITGLDFPDALGVSSGTAYDLTVTLETPDLAGDATITMGEGRFVNAGAVGLIATSLWAYYEARSFNGAGVALPADGANITTSWQDLSGNARHMTVTGTPTFETAELNGYGVVRLGADSNDYFTIPSMAALTSGTIFIVQKVTDVSTNAGHKLGSYAGNDGYYPYTPDTPDGIYETFGSSDRKTCGGSKVPITNWHVTHMQSKTNDWNLWQDGMLVHNDTTHTVGFGTAPTIGFNGAAYMKADIAAIYIFSNNMSAANAAAMYRYIAQVWGC